MKREDARSRIKTSPKRDVVRAAGLSQTLYAPKHSLAYLPKPSRKREDSGRSYQRMFDLLIEARMTNKQTQDVGGELIGEPGKPSKIISGGGYNYKRAKHGVRRSEKLGPDKVSNLSSRLKRQVQEARERAGHRRYGKADEERS